jgi:Protein of unknown function (DUF1264)
VLLRIKDGIQQMKRATYFISSAAIAITVLAITTTTILQMLLTTSIAQTMPPAAASNATKPIDGYNSTQGHLNAVRHVFDHPSLRVEHFCKPNDKIMMVCQLYDGDSANATLMGVEYIITQQQYDSLPDREKPYWHAHGEEFRPDRADPMMPELSPEEAMAEMAKMLPTWGKVIITWNPNDDMPSFPPQVQLVDLPFMVNATTVAISTANTTSSSGGGSNSTGQ